MTYNGRNSSVLLQVPCLEIRLGKQGPIKNKGEETYEKDHEHP